MDAENDYLNFLKVFYNDEVYLIDGVLPSEEATAAVEEVISGDTHVTEEPQTEPISPPKFSWHSQGDSNATFAFVLNENDKEALPMAIKERFVNMLKKLNIDIEGVFIANLAGQTGSAAEDHILSMTASKVVVLGAPGIFATVNKPFQISSYQGKQLLFAPPFSEIISDKKLVLSFWELMKKLV